MNARLPGFYKLTADERLQLIRQQTAEPDLLDAFLPQNGLQISQADLMIENAIGVFGMPLGIAVNFMVNGRDVLIPMAIEEPSVVAGASFMAKLARAGGGFTAVSGDPIMIGQIQLLDVPDLQQAKTAILAARTELLKMINQVDPVLVNLGGGAHDIEVRILTDTAIGAMLVVHLLYDVRDAMGANAVNTAAERIAPRLETLSGGRAHLRILSNLADRRLTQATCRIPLEVLGFNDFSATEVRDGIIAAWAFAEADPYRAATHNKGIMNGIDAVVIATGNDWRAIEAGAHAYAARNGRYTSLSTWSVADNGDLLGRLELPLALGIVGGATRVHPSAKACLTLMQIEQAHQLAEITASVGLAQNLAALRALATEGIQPGHMALHARQIAMAAGANGQLAHAIAAQMVSEGCITQQRALELLHPQKG